MKSSDKQSYWPKGLVVTGVVILAAVWLAHRRPAGGSEAGGLGPTPTAAVSRVAREDLYKTVTIPAEFRPYLEASLNAKVSGYVSQMKVDFGDRVKAGQLLATIEVPELKDQLENAMATEAKAQADYSNADLIYTRLLAVNQQHPDLVAEQELDTARANQLASAAAIAAARAEVEKYQTMASYTNISAPFDGVVTWRYADPGTLIQAGTASDSQALPLVRVSDNYRLRLDFPVSVQYVQDIHLGDLIQIRVDSLDGKTFAAAISRFTGKVDADTRTMMVEIEVPNPDLSLVPGMYATVIINVQKHADALSVPVQAVGGGKEPRVLVVNQSSQIEERPVVLGLETPDRYEILSGVAEGDLVVVGDHSTFTAGQKVEAKLITSSNPNEVLH